MDYVTEEKHHTTFERPNYTQVPNLLFDSLLKDMGEAELKVSLCIIRKIIGYHKFRPEAVSLSQIQKMTGLSRPSCIAGLEQAIERGIIQRVGSGKRGVALFQIVHADEDATSKASLPVKAATSKASLPVTSKASLPTKEKKKKIIKDSIGDNNSPIKGRAAKPYYDAISKYTSLEGALNTNLEKMLNGIATDVQHKPYNLDPAVSLEEFTAWASYWRKENPSLTFLQSPAKIQSSILSWRKTKTAPKPQWGNAFVPDMTPESELTGGNDAV